MFVATMQKEMTGHKDKDDPHWDIIPANQMKSVNGIKSVPVNTVWALKRKRDPLGNTTKHKARLNVHGGQTTQGVHYWDTYVPVFQ